MLEMYFVVFSHRDGRKGEIDYLLLIVFMCHAFEQTERQQYVLLGLTVCSL